MANVKIEERLIPSGNACRSGKVRPKKWIVIHETGNPSKNADALAHANYLNNLAKKNDTNLSWHYTVDDKRIIRHIPDNEVAWHAGDGSKEGGGNMAGIAIEICVNPECNFNIAMQNAESLAADLMKTYNLPISAVKQHHDFSPYGKNCPMNIRNKGLWNDFIKGVSAYYEKMTKPDTEPKPAKTPNKYKVGDRVVLNGAVYSDSYGSKRGQRFSYKVCTVTKVADTERYSPYLLDNGLGWARENELSAFGEKPKTLTAGVRVRVNGNLYTTSYAEKPVRAISGNFTVTKVIKGRAAGVLIGGDYGWVREQDCTVI